MQGANDTSDWLPFRRSSACGMSGCVEVSFSRNGDVRVRDGKADPAGPVLHFDRSEWRAFVAGVRNREFDGPPEG